nr:hypothetical protein [Stutzerimonas nitrititolerans]
MKRPMTTSRPIRKMMPTVLPMNFSMAMTPVHWVHYLGLAAEGIVQRGDR